jgi:hypothetical protein
MAGNIFSTKQVIGDTQSFFAPTSESDFYPYFPKVTGLTKKVLNKLYSLTYYQGSLKNLKSLLKDKYPDELAKDLVKVAHEKLHKEYSKYLSNSTKNILDEVNNKQLNAELEATLILNLNDSLKPIDEWQLTVLLQNMAPIDNTSFDTLVRILSNGKDDVQITIRRGFLLDFLSSAKAKIQELNKKFQEVQKQASEFMKALSKALTPSQELLLLQLINSGNIEAFHKTFIKYKQQLESRIKWCRSCSEKLLKVTTQADMNTLKKIIEGSKAGLCAADSALNLKIRKPLEQIINIISSDYIFALFFAGYAINQGLMLTAFADIASFLQFATGAQLFFTNFERWLDVYSNNPFVRILRDIYNSADATSLSLNLSWDIGLNISNAVNAYMTQLNKFLTEPENISTKEAINLICETAAVLWSVGTTVTYRPPVTTEKQGQNTQQQVQIGNNQSASVSSGTSGQGTTMSEQGTTNLPAKETTVLKTDTVTEEKTAAAEELQKKLEQDNLQISKDTALDYSYFESTQTNPEESGKPLAEGKQNTSSETAPETTEEAITTAPAGVFEWDGGAPRIVYIPLLQQAGNYATVKHKFRYLSQAKVENNPNSFVLHGPNIARIEKSGEDEWLELVISNETLYSTDTITLVLRHANDNANSVVITVQPYPAQITFTADIKYTPLAETATLLINASYTTVDQSGQTKNNELPELELKVSISDLDITNLAVKSGKPAQIPSAPLANKTQVSMRVDYSDVARLFEMPDGIPTTSDVTATITKVGPNKVNKIRIDSALTVSIASANPLQTSQTQTPPELLGIVLSPSRQFIAYAINQPLSQFLNARIGIASRTTGDQTQITMGSATSFVWHPSKDFLLFIQATLGSSVARIVACDAARAVRTAETKVLFEYPNTQFGETALRNLSISADGSKIAWSTANALHVATLHATNDSIDLGAVVDYPIGNPDEKLLAQSVMQLSPDGTKIAYAHSNTLFLFETSSNTTSTIATDVNVKYISWSPDGRYIAFVDSPGGSEQRQIEIFDTRSSALLDTVLQASSKGQPWVTWLSNNELVYEPDSSAAAGDLACYDLGNPSQPSVRAISVIRDQVASALQSAEVCARYAKFYLAQTNDSYELKAVMEVATNVIGIGQAAEQ